MEYLFLPPPYDLNAYISHFWVGIWDVNARSSNTRHIIIANSLLEITFAFADHTRHAELLFATVQGQTDKPRQDAVPGFYKLLGVSIYAHAIPNLFGLPAAALHNEHLSLNTFLSSKADALSERIALANTTEERVGLLSDFFRARLKKTAFKDKLMLHAMHKMKLDSDVKIAELAQRSCLSQKQFNRRFKDFTGFNPKLFARIIRLEAAIKSYVPNAPLTDLAHRSGYYDQAHFIHEFKTLTDFSPGDFWKLTGD
ncbi:helix-turn-helix domain-containing protein [Niabella sp. CC-SYL272]|uniref:helix-turn-helix domain-containing protein n=1 Tax=Niabella agricola TaxID=2891571 RepID=UPI001F292313|nr:helix-turn-helix domain-containing protein [Niabella agricola]MCF3107617.1 helix-turn-helix domain-containing protein [Niabella agricola]